MTQEEIAALVHRLSERHAQVTRTMRRRPRKAAKQLCEEFRALVDRGDFWNELRSQSERLAKHEGQANELLPKLKDLIDREVDALAKIGVDNADSSDLITNVYTALQIAQAQNADVSPQGVDLLRSLFARAADVICRASRGPILHTFDFILSKKGALALAGTGIGAANLWLAAAEPVTALASLKAAVSVAKGELSDISDFFE